MPLDKNLARGVDLYEKNGEFRPHQAIHEISYVIAQSNRGFYRDSRFRKTMQTCVEHNIVPMSYNQYQVRLDWKRQADIMLEQARDLPVAMYWWAYDAAGGNTLTPQSARDTVDALRYLRDTRGNVGVYGNRTDISYLYKYAPAAREYPLWIAQYPTHQGNWDATPNIQPYGGKEFPHGVPWLVWQYASEKNWLGFDTGREWGLESWSVDINAWRGPKEHMLTYLGLYEPKPVGVHRFFRGISRWGIWRRPE